MLVLGRKVGQSVYISPNISVVVLGIKGSSVTLGFECPRSTKILRDELIASESETGCREGHSRRSTDFVSPTRDGILHS